MGLFCSGLYGVDVVVVCMYLCPSERACMIIVVCICLNVCVYL